MFRRILGTFVLVLMSGMLLTGCMTEAAASSEQYAETSEGGSGPPVDKINRSLGEISAAVRAGDYIQAENLRTQAYLAFEEGLEHQLATRNPELKEAIEGLFGAGSQSQPGLAALIAAQAPAGPIDVQIEHLQEEVTEAQELLRATMTGPLAVLNSMMIILREGLEAVLIIAAVLGYLRATKRDVKYQLWVYAGVLIGIMLSVVTWWASSTLLTITTANRELLEGVTSLLAVAVIFYVTNWLFHQVYVVGWMNFVKGEIGKSLRAGSLAGLVFLSFTIVYREGFETVLFYQALVFDASPVMVLTGFVLGAAIIIALAYAILRLSVRVPIKPLFTITGIVLLILAVRLSGVGIHQLQEAGIIGSTLLSALPTGNVIADVLGLFPTVETTVMQIVLLAGVTATFTLSRWQWARRAAPEARANS